MSFVVCFYLFSPISFQIRVINAFRMSVDTRYDNRSMSSMQSYHSVQNIRRAGRPNQYPSSTEMSETPTFHTLPTSNTAPGRVSETTAI